MLQYDPHCKLLQVEVQALPLMVDCRPAAGAPGAPPHDLAHAAPNGVDNHQNQVNRFVCHPVLLTLSFL